jgi:hypothetical protein
MGESAIRPERRKVHQIKPPVRSAPSAVLVYGPSRSLRAWVRGTAARSCTDSVKLHTLGQPYRCNAHATAGQAQERKRTVTRYFPRERRKGMRHSLRRSPGFEAKPRVGGVSSPEGRIGPSNGCPRQSNWAPLQVVIAARRAADRETAPGSSIASASSLGSPWNTPPGEKGTGWADGGWDRPIQVRAAIPRGAARAWRKGEGVVERWISRWRVFTRPLYLRPRPNQRGTVSRLLSRGQIITNCDSLPLLSRPFLDMN